MNEASNKSTDLIPGLVSTLHQERFFGETILKWEDGEVTLVKIHRAVKRDGVKKLIS